MHNSACCVSELCLQQYATVLMNEAPRNQSGQLTPTSSLGTGVPSMVRWVTGVGPLATLVTSEDRTGCLCLHTHQHLPLALTFCQSHPKAYSHLQLWHLHHHQA